MSIDKVTTKPIEAKDYKKEDAEIKRASQENNYIYSLLKKAQNGSCGAIKKLLEHSLINFNPNVEFAAKLMEEAGEMLSEAISTYTDSKGSLSDTTLKTAQETVLNDSNGKMSDMEMAQEYNNLVSDLEISCSGLK